MTWHNYAYEGGQIMLDLDEGPIMQARLETCYERPKVDYMLSHLRPGDIFVDVGAHVGYFALLAAKLVGETGQVFAYEADYGNFTLLHLAAKLNEYHWLHPFNLAIGAALDVVSIQAHGCHSGQKRVVRRGLHSDSIIQAALNQLLLDRVDMLKIDVEGMEQEVLLGATKLFERNPDIRVLIDLHPTLGADVEAVRAFLRMKTGDWIE